MIDSCTICQSPLICNKCAEGKFLSLKDDKCLKVCPDGEYGENGECKVCSEAITDCGICTEPKTCKKCSNFKVLSLDKTKCLDECPVG